MSRIKKRRIVLSGSYGNGNLGDETICTSIVRDIFFVNQKSIVSVLVFNRKLFLMSHPDFVGNKMIRVRSLYYRKRNVLSFKNLFYILLGFWDILRADLFIWGGGGIIRNKPQWLKFYIVPLFFAIFFRKRIFICCIGVDYRITNPTVKKIIKKIKRVNVLSFRDYVSRDAFIENSQMNNGIVIADPVFHLTNRNQSQLNTKEILIGINVTSWDAQHKKETSFFLDNLAQVFNRLSGIYNIKLLILSTALKDLSIEDIFIKFILKTGKIQITRPSITTVDDYLKYASVCDLFLGMRMHSIVLASLIRDLPILGIIYSHKVKYLVDKNKDLFFSIDDVVNRSEILLDAIKVSLDKKNRQLMNFVSLRKSSMQIIDVLKKIL